MTVGTFTLGTAPGALPLIGHAGQLKSRPLDFFHSLHRYGDLVEIKLGRQRTYIVCHPQLLHQILTDDRTYDKGGPFYDRARELLGNALGNSSHAAHRRQRRLLQPAFQPTQLAAYGPAVEREVAALVAAWRPGEVVDAFPVFGGLCLRILTRTLFSTQADDSTVSAIQEATQVVLSMLVRRMSGPQPLQHLPTAANRRYEQAHRYLKVEVDRLIAECRRTGAAHGDLLSMLVSARDDGDGGGLDDEEIRDQVINLLLAGTENPASALTWALYLLTQHPTVRDRLQQEVDPVLRGRVAGWGDLPNLPYTGAVLTETLRLYPPVWMVTRSTTAPIEVAGRTLPAGTTIVFSPAAVRPDGGAGSDGYGFEPARWLPGQPTSSPRSAFTAFGAGARRCIADVYSMNETTLALASIVAGWRVECAPGTDARPNAMSGALRPRRLLLRLEPRTPAVQPVLRSTGAEDGRSRAR